ncbi:MAG: nicotinate-nucleotide adenylyltransferase [Pseudomonadota bacterium]
MIALYGGTFDPFHNGHLRLAIDVFETLRCESVHIIPSAKPVHREHPSASPRARWDMVKLGCEGVSGLVPNNCEIERATPSYAIETIKGFRAQYPEKPIAFVLGADAYAQFDTWFEWQEILDHAHLLVIQRPEETYETDTGDYKPSQVLNQWAQSRSIKNCNDFHEKLAGLICFSQIRGLAVSATQIREKIVLKQSVAGLVSKGVERYIMNNHLYCD